jgi:hypothetical protein
MNADIEEYTHNPITSIMPNPNLGNASILKLKNENGERLS